MMTVSEKAKVKLDEATREIKESIENLKQEVAELTQKVKERIKGSDEEIRQSTEELNQEVKGLSKKVKDLIPWRKKDRLPVRTGRYPEVQDQWQQPFLAFREATDRLFDDFFRSMRWPSVGYGAPWESRLDVFDSGWPRADMSETVDEITVTAELPGVDKDNIDISVTDDRITIRGEKSEEDEEKAKNYYRVERSYGSFQRSFRLPCEVETDKVEASFKRGILTVKLPKTATARQQIKKIPIKTS